MPRPEYVTNEDIFRWDEKIDEDPNMSPAMRDSPIVREVCYAGQWMAEKLTELNCPDHLIGRMMWTAGELCFGRKDPWAIHQEVLNSFIDGTIVFEIDPEGIN
jgi:hypothetical protein